MASRLVCIVYTVYTLRLPGSVQYIVLPVVLLVFRVYGFMLMLQGFIIYYSQLPGTLASECLLVLPVAV
jgi:hypothetical protein